MNRPIERLRILLQEILTADENNVETIETQTELMFDKILSWIIGIVLPISLITLTVNLTIMFTMPIEVAASKWFWIKDLISIMVGYLTVRFYRKLIQTN